MNILSKELRKVLQLQPDMAEVNTNSPTYTERQIALIKGEVDPANDEEMAYADKHASDQLPLEGKSKRKPLFSVTGDDLAENDQRFKKTSFADHYEKAREEKEEE